MISDHRPSLLILFYLIFIPACGQQFTEVFKNQIKGQELGFSSWCDINSDGYLDIFITGLNLVNGQTDFDHSMIYLNNQGDHFTDSNIKTIPRLIYGDHDWGDFNNDGKPDLLISGTTSGYASDGISRIYLNTTNSFELASVSLPGVVGGQTKWIDYDNDGWLDILIMGFDSSNQLIIKIYKNNQGSSITDSNVTFSTMGGQINNLGKTGVAIQDFDNDGDKDILIGVNSTMGYSVDLYENKAGNFTKKNIALPKLSYVSLAVADFNSDGIYDVVINGINESQTSNTFSTTSDFIVMKGEAGLTFSVASQFNSQGSYWGNVSAADVNMDGLPDIMINGTGNGAARTRFFMNTNGLTFSEFNSGVIGTLLGDSHFGDFDYDGDLDVLVTGSFDGSASTAQARVYQNNIANINQRPKVPLNVKITSQNGKTNISWDQSTDSNTPSKSISYNVKLGSLLNGNDKISSLSLNNGTRVLESIGNIGLRSSLDIKLHDGIYYFQVQSLDASFFESEFTTPIAFCVTAPPQVTYRPHYCYGEQVVLTAIGESLKWYSDQTLTNPVNEGNNLELVATADHTLYVTQTVNGCTSAPSRIDYSVSLEPQIVIEYDGIEIKQDEIILAKCSNDDFLNVTAKSNYPQIEWNTGGAGILKISEEGVYTALASDNYCKAEKSIKIRLTVLTDIPIPNVITPNNDGYNDYFHLDFIDQTEASFTLYNRYGQQVYHAASYQNDFEGRDLTQATYYYTVTIDNCNKDVKGWLQIIR